jgi:hypothetical protein
MKLLPIILLAAACGGKATPASTTATSTTPPATEEKPVTLPEGVAFEQLDQDQRIEFMKQKVMPAMKPIFQNHDATKYAEFGCKTCHGEQAAQGHFDMPNPDLPKLNFKDQAAMAKFKKEDLEWMAKEVKPTMAKLLSLPEFTPENPKGFGCTGCHTMAE